MQPIRNLALRLSLLSAVSIFGVALAGGSAQAGALLQNGNTFLGVNDQGHLNFSTDDPIGSGTFGVFRLGVGDATSPGCLCEGWGVAATTPGGTRISGGADGSSGFTGLAPGGTFGSTANTATSVVELAGQPIRVTHQYGPSLAPEVFQGTVSIRNLSDDTAFEDLVYRRAMDWDIPPTEFDEFVTHQGVEANLVTNGGNVRAAVDNGFVGGNNVNTPLSEFDEIVDGTFNTDFVDAGPADHGSAFDFAFGDLAPGETRNFNIFYGSAPNEDTAENAVENILNADVYSFGQANNFSDDPELGNPDGEPATFIFAFGGVGGVEPGATPERPVLPFVPAPGEFEFTNPEPRQWFDPPFSDTFEYELVGSDPSLAFTEVGVPPASFGFGSISVFIPGIGVVATLAPGDIFNFSSYPGVTLFQLTGIDPLLDLADPGLATAFPTFLDFAGTPDALRMTLVTLPPETSVPVPGVLWLLLPGLLLLGLGLETRRRLN